MLDVDTAGRHTIKVEVDTENAIEESNEENNQAALDFDVREAARPDLTITHLAIDPPQPTPRDTITFAARIQNIGRGSSRACQGSVVIELDGRPFRETFDIPALAAEGVYRMTYERQLDAGAYLVEVTADSTSTVTEEDERNNSRSRSFTVTR